MVPKVFEPLSSTVISNKEYEILFKAIRTLLDFTMYSHGYIAYNKQTVHRLKHLLSIKNRSMCKVYGFFLKGKNFCFYSSKFLPPKADPIEREAKLKVPESFLLKVY